MGFGIKGGPFWQTRISVFGGELVIGFILK
jgi:hypothetical protein